MNLSFVRVYKTPKRQILDYANVPDEKLMTHLKNGDKAAFNALYDRYSSKLGWYFYRMLNMDKEKADDFVQDLFMKIIEKPGRFDAAQKFSTWVYTLAANMCKNEYRRLGVRTDHKNGVEKVSAERAAIPTPDAQAQVAEFSRDLQKALGELPEENRTIFLMKHYEGYSLKEISDVVNLKEGTVKSRLFYTIKKLEKALSHHNENGGNYEG